MADNAPPPEGAVPAPEDPTASGRTKVSLSSVAKIPPPLGGVVAPPKQLPTGNPPRPEAKEKQAQAPPNRPQLNRTMEVKLPPKSGVLPRRTTLSSMPIAPTKASPPPLESKPVPPPLPAAETAAKPGRFSKFKLKPFLFGGGNAAESIFRKRRPRKKVLLLPPPSRPCRLRPSCRRKTIPRCFPPPNRARFPSPPRSSDRPRPNRRRNCRRPAKKADPSVEFSPALRPPAPEQKNPPVLPPPVIAAPPPAKIASALKKLDPPVPAEAGFILPPQPEKTPLPVTKEIPPPAAKETGRVSYPFTARAQGTPPPVIKDASTGQVAEPPPPVITVTPKKSAGPKSSPAPAAAGGDPVRPPASRAERLRKRQIIGTVGFYALFLFVVVPLLILLSLHSAAKPASRGRSSRLPEPSSATRSGS